MAARLAFVLAFVALAAWAGGGHATPAAAPAVTLADGAFSQSNSREGQAILSASGMAPGSSAEGTVTIANTGSTAAGFTLVRSAVDAVAGAGGGSAADILQLEVEDLSAGRTVYSGPLMAMSPPGAGRFAPGESRSFRFKVTLPEAAGNAYAGSSAGVTFQWLAVHDDPPRPPTPPDTGTRPQPQPNPTPPPPPPPPPPASAAPRLTLTAAKAQRVLRQGGAIVTARCDQACSLRADGSLRIARTRAQRSKMTPARARLVVGRQARLKVRLSRAAKKSLRAALRKRRKVRLSVKVTATNAAGQSRSATRPIRVKR